MSCCGKKRQELNSFDVNPRLQYANTAKGYNPENKSFLQNNVTFRYTGNRSLRVKSVFNHRVYDFSSSDTELIVMAEDVAMMRGYSELIELKIK